MTTSGTPALWSALGLSSDQVTAYQSLLHDPTATLPVRSETTGLSTDRLGDALTDLAELGLVLRRDDDYRPVRPSAALVALSHARRAALDHAESVAEELDEVYGAGAAFSRPSGLFEVIRGSTQIIDRLRELVATATVSIDSVDTPPYVAGPDPRLHDAETAAIRRGVRIRTIVDFSALDDVAHVRDVLRSVEEGQEVRLSSKLRTKMLVVDGTHVLIPLAVELSYGEPHVAVIAHREIVDALEGYFERLFETAVSLDPVAMAPASGGTGVMFSPPEQRLLQLLSSGMNDGAIAAHLGVSERTLRRHIGALQDRLGARGRFQLGQLVERARHEQVRPLP